MNKDKLFVSPIFFILAVCDRFSIVNSSQIVRNTGQAHEIVAVNKQFCTVFRALLIAKHLSLSSNPFQINSFGSDGTWCKKELI